MAVDDSQLPILGILLLYSSIFGIRACSDSAVEGTLLFIMNSFGLYKTIEQTTLFFGFFIAFLMLIVTWYCYQFIHFFTLDILNVCFFYILSLCQIEAKYPLARGNIEYQTWGFLIIGHVTQAILLHSWLTNQPQKLYTTSHGLNALGTFNISL